jgi:branched-chain amino acid transport system permease protein
MTSVAQRRFSISAKQALAICGGLLGVCWLVLLFLHPSDQLQNAIFGVGEGALVGAIALSVTLTYSGSGVVNFAAAAVSMYSAFIFYDLRNLGRIFLPPPFPNIQIAHVRYVNEGFLFHQPVPPLPIWLSFLLTLVECVVLGLLFHFLIFRPLRKAPPLAKVVASIGLLIVLQESASLRHPSSSYNFESILPTGSWTVGGVAIPQDTAIMLAIVVVLAAAFWAIFKFTRFGLATRAAAENERGALILGYNPNRYAGVNWVLSTVLAGALGILFASVNGSIDPLTITLLIVPALAASLLGRFSSFPITVVAALLLGSTTSWLTDVSGQSWVPSFLQTWAQNNLPFLLPFLVIVLVLFIGGEKLPTRGSVATMRMPRAPAPRHALAKGAVLFVLVLVAPFLMHPDWRLALQTSIIASIVCASLVVLTGLVGQISLMQMTIAGVAGFVLSKVCDTHGIGFPWGPLIAAGVATIVGLVAAVPALRIRGVNLAVVTLSAAVVIENVVYNLPAFQSGLSASSQTNVASPTIFGLHFGPGDPWTPVFGHPSGSIPNPWFSVFCLIVATIVIASVVWIRRSRLGRKMLAVRSNERAAAAAGVSVAGTKLLAFAIAAFIAGIAGCMFSYSFQSVDPLYFSSFNSLVFLAVAYLGGIAMVGGSPIGGALAQGALFATFLAVVAHISPEYSVLIAGVGLIFASINNPEGIAGTIRNAREGAARGRQRRRQRQLEAREALEAAAAAETVPADAAPVGTPS